MKRVLWLFLTLFTLVAQPSHSVEPDEILDDPKLEERARAISAELRCLVCQNESIDDSNADLARDLRLLVRERLVVGESDEDVLAYIVARFGEFVLLRPNAQGSNLVLWLAGPVMLVLAIWVVLAQRRKVRKIAPHPALSSAEQERLEQLTKSE